MIYYLLIPLISLIIIWEIKKEKIYFCFACNEEENLEGGVINLGKKEQDRIYDRHDKIIKNSYKKMKRFQVYLIIALIISIPVWHLVTVNIVHEDAHFKKVNPIGPDSGGGMGEIDPVIYQIKPTYDISSVKEKMEKYPKSFRPEIVYEAIDIDDLTRIPGKMAVYRLGDSRILVTYTYLSPYPVVRGFAINLFEYEEDIDYIVEEETFVYPESPGDAGDFGKIVYGS